MRRGVLLALVPLLLAGGPPNSKVKRGPTMADHAGTTSTSTRSLSPMGKQGVAMGEHRLAAGQYLLAAGRFELELKADPTLIRARRGLALARAGLKQCDAAVVQLQQLRAQGVWDVDLAVADGNCALRDADDSLAEAAFSEAVLVDPDSPDAWYGLAVVAVDRGDWEAYDAAVDGIDGTAARSPRARAMHALAAATAYQRLGGDDAWEALQNLWNVLDERTSARGGRLEAYTIEGELWLAAGNPILATRSFGEGAAQARRAPRIGSLRAEALRRTGALEEASRLFEVGRAEKGEHVTKKAILARVRTDEGNLTDARAILDDSPHAAPEILASEWYYARAMGDQAGMARWAAKWRDTAPSPDESLDQLIPWGQP